MATAGKRNVSIVLVVAIGALTCEGRAHGQAIGPPPTFPVEISTAKPGVIVELRGPEGPVECGERCALTLPQNNYKMIVRDADGHASTQWLEVTMPMHATVTPPDHGALTFGIVSGLTGLVVAAVSAVVLVFSLFLRAVERIDCDGMACTSDGVPNWLYYAGGIGLAGGLALGATGLILWRQNAHADVRVDAVAPPPPNGARLRVLPVAGRQWAGLALTARF